MVEEKVKYRPEIDGLRAFAIIPVLFFHAGFSWMPGGFLGVDLFFVISGYLITGVILRDLIQGTFSLASFYERRVRRILPALIAVIIATLAVAPFFTWPWQFEELGESTVASALFFSNYYFFFSVDYFRPDAEMYPLLHMWSLSIEEQYYLIFPILLAVIWKLQGGLRAAIITTFTISLASLIATAGAAEMYPDHVFYLIEYRIFELGIGSLTAMLTLLYGRLSIRISDPLGFISLIIIVISMIIVPKDAVDPWTKIPLLLATALLLAGKFEYGPTYRILTWLPLRWIGLLSFSIYLWHQPVLAFARMELGSDLSVSIVIFLLSLSIFLAFLTYRYVETTFRTSSANQSQVLRAGAIGIVFLVVLGLGALSSAHLLVPSNPMDRQLAISMNESSDYLTSNYKKYSGLSFTEDERPKILIVGDSHSQDFVNILSESANLARFDILTHYIRFRCQPYLGDEDVQRFIRKRDRSSCKNRDLIRPPAHLLLDADLVIFASRWEAWAAERLPKTLQNFAPDILHKSVVVGAKLLRPDFEQDLHLRSFRGLELEDKKNLRVISPDRHMNAQDILENVLRDEKIPFVDFQGLICDDENKASCPLFTPNGDLISYDGSHLTKRGALWVGSLLQEIPELKDFFSPKTFGEFP